MKARCYDCGKPYKEFGMDLNLPRSQWMDIFPEGDGEGLLCAQCTVNRASKLPGATCIHALIEVSPHTSLKNEDFNNPLPESW